MRRRGEEGGGGGVSQPKEKRESHDPHIATTRSHCPHAAYSRPPESETMWDAQTRAQRYCCGNVASSSSARLSAIHDCGVCFASSAVTVAPA